jgi:hypothetical protein
MVGCRIRRHRCRQIAKVLRAMLRDSCACTQQKNFQLSASSGEATSRRLKHPYLLALAKLGTMPHLSKAPASSKCSGKLKQLRETCYCAFAQLKRQKFEAKRAGIGDAA